MKIAFVYFTFGKDEELLRYSLTSLKRNIEKLPEKYSCDIFVFDQDDCPLSSIPDGVIYERTTFPRGNNINGWKCIKGMFGCYCKIADLGYDKMFKIDSDVFVNNLDFLDEYISEDVLGQEPWNAEEKYPQTFCGASYMLSCDAIQEMRKPMKNVFYIEKMKECNGEDTAFSYILKKIGKKIFNCWNFLTEDPTQTQYSFIATKEPYIRNTNQDETRKIALHNFEKLFSKYRTE